MKTIEKALDILDLLMTERREMGVLEISRQSMINKSTVAKLLTTLKQRGYVAKSASTGRYSLGYKCILLGELAQESNTVGTVARPYMEELNLATSETINLAVRDGDFAYYIDMIKSQNTIAVQTVIGNREYLHCSSVGKVLLAFQGKNFTDAYIQKTGLPKLCLNTITDPQRLYKELESVRADGVAVDDEESERAICCIGAPIFNLSGAVVAAMSISGLKMRFTPEKEREYKELIKHATLSVSRELGYQGNAAP